MVGLKLKSNCHEVNSTGAVFSGFGFLTRIGSVKFGLLLKIVVETVENTGTASAGREANVKSNPKERATKNVRFSISYPLWSDSV
jgi:hypothetical protein